MIITKPDNPHYTDMRCKRCGGYLYSKFENGTVYCTDCNASDNLENKIGADAVWVNGISRHRHLMKFIK